MEHASRMRYALVLLGLLVSATAVAGDVSAEKLLHDMAKAYKSRTFEGRLVYMHGARVNTMAFEHAVIDGRQYERISHLDGRPAEVVRAGDQVVCIYPDRKVALSHGSTGIAPLNIHEKVLDRVPQQYNVLLDGSGRVAGRDAWRVRLEPLDEYRYGYHLWIDQQSRLLLKSELVDGQGVPLERAEFVSLQLDPHLTKSDFKLPDDTPSAGAQPASPAGPKIKVSAGWLPDGFVLASRDSRRVEGSPDPLAADTYSDGLSAFTIFVDAPDTVGSEGISRMGPTVALSRRMSGDHGTYMVTLVGEVPQKTAERVLAATQLHEVAGQ